MQERQYLSVIMLGPKNSDILKTVSQLMAQHHCHLVNSHIQAHGELYSLSLLLRGEWSALAKIEQKLMAFEKKYDCQVFLKRTTLNFPEKPFLPYVLYLVAIDEPNNFHQLMRFLSQQPIIVTEVFLDTYKTKNTQTDMINVTVRIQFSPDLSISDWRELFMLFCDDMNFDAIMEPEKP